MAKFNCFDCGETATTNLMPFVTRCCSLGSLFTCYRGFWPEQPSRSQKYTNFGSFQNVQCACLETPSHYPLSSTNFLSDLAKLAGKKMVRDKNQRVHKMLSLTAWHKKFSYPVTVRVEPWVPVLNQFKK